MRSLLSLLIAITIFSIPLISRAQVSDLSIEMIPNNPEPGTSVTLKAMSYGVDLNQAMLSWSYNGRIVSSGVGKTSIEVTAPTNGASGNVSLTASGVGFERETVSIVIRSASLDMLWEAIDSYTPPFYKGKALLPIGGLVRVTAIPSHLAPRGLNYTWSRNGTVLGDQSGYGKSSLLFTQNMLVEQEKIDVAVNGGNFDSTGSYRLNLTNPKIIAYENDEGFIDFANGYKNTINFTKPSMLLRFEPYYFSVPRGILTDLTYVTKIGGEEIYPSRPNEIGLSRPDTSGQSILSLALTTVSYSLQSMEKTFTLNF